MPLKSLSELRKKLTPEQRKRSADKLEALKTSVMIANLRRQMGLTQAELAQRMGITQQAVSKMEWGEDIQVGTFNRVLAALDAELIVHTPVGDFNITNSPAA